MTKYGTLVRLKPNCRRNLNCPQLNRKSQKTAAVSQPSAGDEVERIIHHQKDLQHLKTVQRLLLAHQIQLAYLLRLPQPRIYNQMLRRTILRILSLKSHRPVNPLPQQPGYSHSKQSHLPLLPHPLRESHKNSLSTQSRARPTGQRTKKGYLQKLPEKH